jgi:hypothetical protein
MTVGELNSRATTGPQRPAGTSPIASAHVWNQAASQVSMAEACRCRRTRAAFALLQAINDGLVSDGTSTTTSSGGRSPRSSAAPATATADGSDPAWMPFITRRASRATRRRTRPPATPGARSPRGLRAGGPDITLSHPGIPSVTLHYTTFGKMTDDIDDARYGGIHFRFDQEAGGRRGRRGHLRLQEQSAP